MTAPSKLAASDTPNLQLAIRTDSLSFTLDNQFPPLRLQILHL